RAFRQGLKLIGGEESWIHHRRRALESHIKLAEVLALNADHAEAFIVIAEALSRAQTRLERTQLRALQVSTHLSIGQMAEALDCGCAAAADFGDRKSTRLNSSHVKISYAVFCLKKKKISSLGHLLY